MLTFFTRSFSAQFVLWVMKGYFAASPVMYFISRIVFIYFISSPFSHWRGELRKEREVQTKSEGFLHSSLSVAKRRIRVSHLPVWLTSGALNISNNFWGWEICGFLWVLGESCLNQWQRQLLLLSGLASGAKLCNFYSELVAMWENLEVWMLCRLLLFHTALTPSLAFRNFPSQRKQGKARGGGWGSVTAPCRNSPLQSTGDSFSRNFCPPKRSCGDRDRWGLWKMMSPPFILL